MLAHLAEVDERKLYLPAGYPSLYLYCVQELHLCEQAAFKRIHAARAARDFPALFDAVAQGRLHLSAVVLLAAHLTAENVAGLMAAATHKSKAEIEHLLAERFPRTDVFDWVQEAYPPGSSEGPVEVSQKEDQLPPGKVDASCIRGRADQPARVKPL